MNFVTLDFAVFFLLVLVAGLLCKGRPGLGKGLLLFFNLAFYASAGWSFVPLLLLVAGLNWACVRLLDGPAAGRPGPRKALIATNIALHVLLLAFFKYYEFLILNLEALANHAGLALPQLPMTDMLFPVGLSFYTFQGLSYAIDCYRAGLSGPRKSGPRKSDPEPADSAQARSAQADSAQAGPGNTVTGESVQPASFFQVFLFISFFPTVMAGPILRAEQFFPQLNGRGSDPGALTEGFTLILSGLFKKVVLASYLSEHVVRDVFQAPELYSSWAVLAAVYGYTMQIFCDFSGYSDLAMGIGRLMGFKLPQNFKSPYLALNLQDFWRRWHITLSLWLRDYLYIPLGGSRKGSQALNLIITMGLGGLWHGSHLRFLVWGLLHGLGLAVVHTFQAWRAGRGGWLASGYTALAGKGLAWLLTFHFVALLWVFFRAEDMERALEILRRLFYFGQPGDGFPALVIPAVLAGFAVQIWGRRFFVAFAAAQEHLPWPLRAVLLALAGGLILKMGPDGVLPFIYFQF